MTGKFLLAAVGLLTLVGLSPPPNTNASDKPPIQTPSLPVSAGKQIDSPKPMDLTWEDQQGVFAYGVQSMQEQCKVQPSNLWCSPVKLKEKTLAPWDIFQISLEAKSNFVYKSDVVDNWRVHSSEVLMKQTWQGDCDDLASTTLDMLIRAGQPRRRAWLVLADVEHKAKLDHLIGMVEDADGHYWIVGDTSAQTTYPANLVKYRIVALASMEKPEDWQDPHLVPAFDAKSLQSNPIAPRPVVRIPPLDLEKINKLSK